MDVTKRNPGVIAPSQIPRKTLQANRSPKLFAAAWHSKATAHTKILILQRTLIDDVIVTCGATYLIHLPTGKYWRARFCGHSKTRKNR